MKVSQKKARALRRIALASTLMLLFVAIWLPITTAQEAEQDTDPFPLRPADTSSPRATLQTFLTNVEDVIDGLWRETLTPADIRAYDRAVRTLDFTTTVNGNSSAEQTRRILLLAELLNRFDLPPFEEIPDEVAVREGEITEWRVPDTRLTIRRVATGPRAGAFLFSAETVEALDRYYRIARHLPYKEGAMAGILEEFARAENETLRAARVIRERLRPIDTSSPRSTLSSFLSSVNRAYDLVMDAEQALHADPPTMTVDEANDVEAEASRYLDQAVSTLDLSEVPEALLADQGIETVLQLKEIIDRLPIPPPSTVPGREMVNDARRGSIGTFVHGIEPLTWRFPDTTIEIVEVTEGERKGAFLFSAATVAASADTYAAVSNLRYRPIDPAAALGFLDLDKSEGFYDYYISTPGYLIAGVSPLARFVEGLPPFFTSLVAEQAVWQWIALALAVLIVLAAAVVLLVVLRKRAALFRPPLDGWTRALAPTGFALVIYALVFVVDNIINITGAVLVAVTTVGNVIIIVMLAWAIMAACRAIVETIILSPKIQDEGLDASVLRISAIVVGFAIAAWYVITSARDLGADMIPIFAGLGVGGLAVALAAQKTIANLIGSMIIFANRPVRVGDFCRYGDQMGTVESIGLHSTRIRSLERTIVTVPNAEFSEMKLDNFSVRDERLFKTVLQLRYETTEDQLRFVLTRLRELMLAHPMVTPAPARVRFVAYGAYSKDVEIFAYLRCQDQDTYLAIKEDLLLRIGAIIKDTGTDFAFPSQTAYLGRDGGLEPALQERAEAEIHRLRATGKLPFPEFEDEEYDRLQDSLDYPPQGSPDHVAR